MSYFLGLTFNQNSLQIKKIDSFRQRFDFKYDRSPLLQMTLLAPFEFSGPNSSMMDNLLEEFSEEIECQLMGINEACQIKFSGIDFKSGRKGHLFFRPELPVELHYCQEGLINILKQNSSITRGANVKMRKDTQRPLLPIGRFKDPNLLQLAVETAQKEFELPFYLYAKEICLFEKLPGEWIKRQKVFTFTKLHERLVENDLSFFASR